MSILNTAQQGQKVGMFPVSALERLQQSPIFKQFSPEDQASFLKDALKSEHEMNLMREATQGMNRPQYTLQELGDFREQEARRAQELGKESVKEAFKYGMLANIPKTISQSFGNIAAINLAAGQGIADTYSRTLAAYPRAQFPTFNFQPEKYFG